MRWIKHHSRRDARTGELVLVKSHFAADPVPTKRPLCTSCFYHHARGVRCDWSKPLRMKPPTQMKLF